MRRRRPQTIGQPAPQSAPLNFSPRARGVLWGAWLFALTLIAFGPAWRAGFIWDDDVYVTQNPLLTAVDGLRRIWFSLDSPSQYFPLTYTTFYFEHFCWGLNPAGYHLVNLLLHAANALLVWQLLTRLRLPGAWLAAALFALHPVQVESAAWITERKNVLMGLFFLLSLLQWVRFIDSATLRPWRHYLLALIFYALALSAKTTACTLPVALLLILWLKHMPLEKKRWLQVLPFFALGLAMGLVTIWWERYHQGTQGKLFAMGPLARVLLANRALWFYLGKLLWPVNLIFSYPHWNISVSDPLAYLWVALTLAAAVVIWRLRAKPGRGLEVAALFFAATLAPTLGFIMLYTFVYSFVADHYQYLACIGPFALVAGALATLWQRRGRPVIGPVLCGALLLTLSVLTWRQCRIYSNLITLWQATIDQNPRSWFAEDNLGVALDQVRKFNEAEIHYRKALAVDPNLARAHYNLAVVLGEKGERDKAEAEFRAALAIEPNMAEAHNDLGIALMRNEKLDDAIAELRTALSLDPNVRGARVNLGILFYKKNDWTNAIAQFQKALAMEPDSAQLRNNLGVVLALDGKPAQAIAEFQKSLQIDPNNIEACDRLAWLLAACPDASLRNGAMAVTLAQHAADLADPGNPILMRTLAAAYAEAGKFEDAAATARHALEISVKQKNAQLEGQLRAEIKLYDARQPARGPIGR